MNDDRPSPVDENEEARQEAPSTDHAGAEVRNEPPPKAAPGEPSATGRARLLAGTALVAALATVGVGALLVDISGRKQEAERRYLRVVEVDETTSDPEPWGQNWPHQYDGYLRTAETARFYGGSSAMPEQKLEENPWLKRMYAGYAFSLDYREARGHAYMLSDQLATKRVTERSQPGACLHCHASVVPTYRRVGRRELGREGDGDAGDFDWPAVQRGFEELSTIPYPEAYEELEKTPDGTGEPDPHPVSCLDCHDPGSMAPRVTRPAFVRGIAALAASDAEVPHLPSVESWRRGPRERSYDPNRDASRQEMRIYVCAQCHVEYYCGPKETLFFPWDRGLRVEQIEATYAAHDFPGGEDFYDWKHGETGARLYKAQHPEFELWSQGIHARSGVGCADCHMPYQRVGARKLSSHWVQSPMHTVNASCQTCHNVPEEELRGRVETIQTRHKALIDRAAAALVDMLDALGDARAAGADEAELAPLLEQQRRAQWRLDFISSENSMGFHAAQEAARVLAGAIDHARQAQARAVVLRARAAPGGERPRGDVQGVTPRGEAPIEG